MELKSWQAILSSLLASLIIRNGLANASNFKCDFEEGDCGFSEYMQSDLDWVWGAASTGIGPDVDNTLGTSAGHYLYLDTMTSSTSLMARTSSPFFSTTTAYICAEIYVFSSSWSTATLTGFAIASEFKSFMDLGRFGGSREGVWRRALLEIPPQRLSFQLIFVADIKGNTNGLILAIDDIRISEGLCPALETFECTFEDQNICGCTYDTTATFAFIRQNLGTPTPATGPTMDHTLNNANGYYMRIEANKIAPGSSARLITPAIQATHSFDDPSCLVFWYHMYGKHMGYLNVYVMTTDNIPSTITLSEATMIWSLNGDQGDAWKIVEVGINMAKEFMIIFEALRGSGNKGDTAIDDVQLLRSANCPISESSTKPTTDRTTHSLTTTSKVTESTAYQQPSTINTPGSVQSTLIDKIATKLSISPDSSKINDFTSKSLKTLQTDATPKEPTTPPFLKSTSSELAQSAATWEHTTAVSSTSIGPMTMPPVSETSPPTDRSTSLNEQTTVLLTVLKSTPREWIRSTSSLRHTTLMASSVKSFTAHPTSPTNSFPASVNPTSLHGITIPIGATSPPNLSELSSAGSTLSTATSDKDSTSIYGFTAFPTVSMNDNAGSVRLTTTHESTPSKESTTLATASKVETSVPLQTTVLTEGNTVKNKVTAHSFSDYIVSVDVTTLDLTGVAKATNGTDAPSPPAISEGHSSATFTNEVSEGPSIGTGSFLQNNKILVISLGIVLGVFGIGTTLALVGRFLKPHKHRGHKRVGAVEVTKLPSTDSLQNAWVMTGKTTGLPSVESVGRSNIYHT